MQILKDKNNVPRGFAFVLFDSKLGVDRALAAKHTTILNRKVDIQIAHPKSFRKASGVENVVPEKLDAPYGGGEVDPAQYYQSMLKAYADAYRPQAASALATYYEQYYAQYTTLCMRISNNTCCKSIK